MSDTTYCCIPLPPPPPWRPTPMIRAGFARLVTPKRCRQWRAKAAPFVRSSAPATPYPGAVVVDIVVVAKRPKRLLRKKDPAGLMWAVIKPDVDNVAKTILDIMTKHRWWHDDDQVVGLTIHRLFAERGGHPRISIAVAPARSGEVAVGEVERSTLMIHTAELPKARRDRVAEVKP